jgi:hypothetical protein
MLRPTNGKFLYHTIIVAQFRHLQIIYLVLLVVNFMGFGLIFLFYV